MADGSGDQFDLPESGYRSGYLAASGYPQEGLIARSNVIKKAGIVPGLLFVGLLGLVVGRRHPFGPLTLSPATICRMGIPLPDCYPHYFQIRLRLVPEAGFQQIHGEKMGHATHQGKGIKPLTLAIAGLFYAANTWAQVTSHTELPSISVTASPIIDSNQVDGFSTLTTRVSDKQIKDLGALSLPDALRMMPGVQVSLYDAVGNYSGNQGGSVYVRGMGTSRPGSEIKTYLDGLPVYMGLWNHPLMDLLPLNSIQTIEVNKGPQPLQSGNNFASVNLQTKTPKENGIHGDASVAVGSYGTHILQGMLLGRMDAVDFVLAVGSADSNGHRANGDANLKNALGKITFRFNDVWSAGMSFLHVENRVGDPGDNRYAITTAPIGPYQSNGVGRNNSATNMVTAFVTHQSEGWRGEFKVYANKGKNDIAQDANWGTFNSSFDMSGLRWKEQVTPWQGGELVAGIDYDAISGSISGPHVGSAVGTPGGFNVAGSADIPTFRVTSPFIGINQKFNLANGWVLQPSVGVRSYQSNVYASKSAPNAGLSLMGENLTVYANYSEGILYPGAETYSLTRALPMAFTANNGWNTLSPEKNKHTEIGAKWDVTPTTHLDVSLFQDDVSKRYVWSGFNGGATGVWSNNFPDYKTRGAEASVRQDIGADWVVFAGVTHLDTSVSKVPFAPKMAYSAGANGKVANFRVAFDAQHQTKMYSQTWDRSLTGSNDEVKGFTVANLRIAYPLPSLGKKGEVFVSANNLFNAAYEYNAGYPMPGRNYRVGLNASF